MINKHDLVRRDENFWEIPSSLRKDMRVPAHVHVSETMLDAILADKSLEQLMNVCTLPGIESHAIAMPDIHQGYGFPVGGVAAIRTSDGIISPGGIGYDINCGVRLLTTNYCYDELKSSIKALAHQIERDVPSGTGRSGAFVLSEHQLDEVLNLGVRWALKHGYASAADLDAIEQNGWYDKADAQFVSSEAKRRGLDQLGTMGSGNHFIEIQKVAKIFDSQIAEQFGIHPNMLCIMVHTGSRGLGHQVCTDYVRVMNRANAKFGFVLPDKELACAPMQSEEGQQYFKAMAAGANYAWVNRQVITHQIRNAWQQVLKTKEALNINLLYDVSHNIAKLETYGSSDCLVHRKGATRAYGPGQKDLAPRFKATGQPVIIPGSMGTASYVLSGTEKAMTTTFGSCCHGAGRSMSRMRAKKTLDYPTLMKELTARGVHVCSGSRAGLLEEAPEAYKDVDQVVDVVANNGIAKIVAKLTPVAVIKG